MAAEVRPYALRSPASRWKAIPAAPSAGNSAFPGGPSIAGWANCGSNGPKRSLKAPRASAASSPPAWRRSTAKRCRPGACSLADKQVTLESPGDDDDAQPKRTRRTTTLSGQAALLGKAMQAAKDISKVQAQQLSQARRGRAAERARDRLSKIGEPEQLKVKHALGGTISATGQK